jgi:drug/metabolite transporter (DMT)-like permease
MVSLKRIILPVATALCFAGSFPAAKYASLDLLPLSMAFFRYLITLLFLSSLLWHYKLATLKIDHRDLYKFFFLGTLGIVGYHFFFFISIRHTTVANTAVINAFNPVITAGLASLLIKERLGKLNYTGLIVALAGVMFLVTRGDIGNLLRFNFNIGDLYMLCAVVCWVLYSILVKNLSSRYGNFTITFYAALFGVVQLCFLIMLEDPMTQIRNISLSSFLSLLYMGIIASGIGYLLYNSSIKENGPTRTASVVYSLIPIFVGLLSFLLLKETISGILIISTILIISGLNFVLRNQSEKRE